MKRILIPAAAALCLSVSVPALAAPGDWAGTRVADNNDEHGQHNNPQNGQHGTTQTGQHGGQQGGQGNQGNHGNQGGQQGGQGNQGNHGNTGGQQGGQGNQGNHGNQGGQQGGQGNQGTGNQHGDWRGNTGNPGNQHGDWRGNNNGGPVNTDRGNAQRFNTDRGHSNFDRSQWQRNFRADRHYHWRPYVRPQGWYARQWSFGLYLPNLFWSNHDYWISDYEDFGLPDPPDGYIWVRNGDDALLIDENSGYILQVVYGVFY